ncbi:MAG TPA: hypothetical protein VJ832_09895 [Variovorax sp.]|nr:hypothetical protein [Variovorax sp.]
MTNAVELRVRVLLTLQVALLGMVTANMRSVVVSWTDKDVRIRVVFDEKVAPGDAELASEIESEVISHLPHHTAFCEAEACVPSKGVEISAGEVLVFQRARGKAEQYGSRCKPDAT